MNPDLVHHGFQWQLGDNVDTVPFKPERLCEAGGLHFTTLEQLSNFFIVPANVVTLMDHWLAEVTVDADEPVWEEQSTAATGWKAHRVTVKSLTRMRDVPQHERLTIALGCPVERQYNPEIMAQMWAAAVAHNNMSLALLPAERQTDELVEVAVTHYPSSFRHVANQTFDVCCRAVSINPTCQKRIRDDAMRLRRMSCREALAHLRLLLKQHVNTMMSLLTVMSMDSVELGVLLKRLNQRAAGIYGALTTVKDDEPVPPQLLETVRDFTLSGRTRSSALAFLFSAL